MLAGRGKYNKGLLSVSSARERERGDVWFGSVSRVYEGRGAVQGRLLKALPV